MRSNRLHICLASTAICALAAGAAGPAQAAAATVATLEEIVVTAQKREERLQDVPVAVTAISGDALSQRQIDDATQLAQAVPSLTFASGNAANNNNIRIRGVGTAVFSTGVESSVSTVLDGVVLARQTQGFVDLADVERIEVLRGPQGTLFGKNATAGVVSIISKRPSRTFTGNVQATVAEGAEYRIKGSISGPITDTVRARLTGFVNDVEGHIYNITTRHHINGTQAFSLRGKVEWDVTPDLNVLAIADYRKTDAHCCASIFVNVDNAQLRALIAPIVASPASRLAIDNRDASSQTTQEVYSIQADWNLGFATLTSITAYQDYFTISKQPVDRLNTPRPIFIAPGSGQLDLNDGTIKIRQWTQEVRLTSPDKQRLSYVVGLYYLTTDIDRDFYRRIGTCTANAANGPAVVGAFCNVPTFSSVFSLSSDYTDNYAAFGQVDYKLMAGLSVLGGFRIQHDKNRVWGVRPNQVLYPGDSLNMAPSQGGGTITDTATTGKVGLQYRFNPFAQAYLTWSTGYKGAGWGTELATDFANQAPVLPEKAESWEAGYKAQLFRNRASVGVAAFRSNVDSVQIQTAVFDPVSGTVKNVLGNAGSAVVKGVELEASARPIPQLSLTGGLSYLRTDFDVVGLNCGLTQQLTAQLIPTGTPPDNQCYRRTATGQLVQNVRNGDLPNAPKWKGTLTVRYEDKLPDLPWRAFVQAAVTAQSKFSFGLTQDPLDGHKGYSIVDLSAGGRTVDGKYAVTVFVRNAFDKHFLAFQGAAPALTSATLTPTNLIGIMPKEASRYFGANLAVNF